MVEIYPRLFSIGVVKSNREARLRHLARCHPRLTGEPRRAAVSSADAFDAAVSALIMERHAEELRNLAPTVDPTVQRGGKVWWSEGAGGSSCGGSVLQRALDYAARLHADQTRKGPDGAPYVAHLLGVCALVLEAGGDEEQAVAALLHDAAEDRGGRERLEEIRGRFGERVADIVEACTDAFEDSKPNWRPRKEDYLADLPGKSADVLLVACADKLYNARAILRDHRRVGDAVFDRFTANGDATLWYYKSLAGAFHESELDNWLVRELKETVSQLEHAVLMGDAR